MGNVWQITQVSLHPAYQRGVFCIPRIGVPSIFIEAKRRRKRSRYCPSLLSLLSSPPLPLLHLFVLRFSRSNLSLSLFLCSSFSFYAPHSAVGGTLLSFAFQRIEFDRLARPSSVSRDETTSIFISSRGEIVSPAMGPNGASRGDHWRVWYGIWQRGNRAISQADSGESVRGGVWISERGVL